MSAAGYRVRVAIAADVAGVVELERSAAEAPHWPEGEYATIVGDQCEANGAVRRCLFVAESKEKLLGFAVGKVIVSAVGCSAVECLAELESVAVSEMARRRGVGRTLCDAVVDWCQVQGALEIDLEVRAESDGAIALYSKLGFAAVGRRVGYYKEPAEDAVLMQLKLVREE